MKAMIRFQLPTPGANPPRPIISPEMIAEWRALQGKGMTSAVGEYTPAEFWTLLDAYEAVRGAPQPLPGREILRNALRRAFSLGQTYWQQADSEYTSQHRKADQTRAQFEALVEETLAALPARSDGVGAAGVEGHKP